MAPPDPPPAANYFNQGQRPRRVNGAANPPRVPNPALPTIRVLAGLRNEAADEGLKALAQANAPFWQRDQQLVRAVKSRVKNADGTIVEVPTLVPVTLPILTRELCLAAEWERVKADGTPVRIDPPDPVVEQIAHMSGAWPFPVVSGVIGTPTMRPDGSLLLTEGYDAETGLVLMGAPDMPSIASSPTLDDALSAHQHLSGLLDEFPFADADTGVNYSVALSMLMTPVLRGALGGAVPLHVVQAPQPGSGKSYLQNLASVLATGERCAVISVSPDPAETEKRLAGAALLGSPIIPIDNCNGILTGDLLAQLTEQPLLRLRPLGTSNTVRIPNTFSVFANGNNITIAADLTRRAVLCTLDANMDSPESRDFRHDPIAELLENRGEYLADVLTIARAYHLAGRPNAQHLPSYNGWSTLVRSAIVWLGLADPAESIATVKADDPDRSTRAAIFDGWADALGTTEAFSCSEVIRKAEAWDGSQYYHPEFRDALMDVAKAKGADRLDSKRLGWWLRGAARVVTGDYKLTVQGTEKAKLYRIVRV